MLIDPLQIFPQPLQISRFTNIPLQKYQILANYQLDIYISHIHYLKLN